MDESAEKIERGFQAAGLLENPAFKDALAKLRDIYVKDWIAATTTERREECHHKMAALSTLIQELQSLMTTGRATRERISAFQGGLNIWKQMNG